jgi:hypothetical protein
MILVECGKSKQRQFGIGTFVYCRWDSRIPSIVWGLQLPKLDLFCLVPFNLLHPHTVGLFSDLVLCVFGPCHGRLGPSEGILRGLPEETGQLRELALLLLGGH